MLLLRRHTDDPTFEEDNLRANLFRNMQARWVAVIELLVKLRDVQASVLRVFQLRQVIAQKVDIVGARHAAHGQQGKNRFRQVHALRPGQVIVIE